MTTEREPRDRAEDEDDAPRAAQFGTERGMDSETSRGTTPIGHGSVEVTQNHEAAREMIMGETEEPNTAAHGDREPERNRARPER